MAKQITVLSDHDAQVLREMVAEFLRTTQAGARSYPSLVDDIHQAPDVYLARTPAGGIPELTIVGGSNVDLPGAAECDLYRVIVSGHLRGNIVPLHSSVAVYNYGLAVDGDVWALVKRDKFGTWWVESPPVETEGCVEVVTGATCSGGSIVVTTTYIRAPGLTSSSTPC